MELVPCDGIARQRLADLLFTMDESGVIQGRSTDYVAMNFPGILLDVARLFIEQATDAARKLSDPAAIVRSQLKPYLLFNMLLGKCPQISGLMYSYFEDSSFQPLPEGLFQYDVDAKKIVYTHSGFTDDIVKQVLLSYFKYLAFNPKWFSAVWNWSELGRFITLHTNHDIRYLAVCCMSVITRPTRPQHISFMRDICNLDSYQLLIDLQIKHRHIFENPFKPCIAYKDKEMSEQFAQAFGISSSGYSYCSESIAKVSNILLLKRDITREKWHHYEYQDNYIPVSSLYGSISKLAYAISIKKPSILRGPSGSGKTILLDHIAAQTNRFNPPDYVKVQIGDQIDSKLLIGSYVCTEIPGQFEWQPGPLTRAMAYGSWIVFEDIDSAPADLAQVIHSVIENGSLSCVSSCPIKIDNPHPDFRIFFTQRKTSGLSRQSLGFVERLCDVIDLPELTNSDLEEALEKRYKFGPLTSIIIQLYRSAEKYLKGENMSRSTRIITLRDLFKLCDRITLLNINPNNGKFSSGELESIYLNAVDCFLSSLPRSDIEACALELGHIVNISSNEVNRLVFQRLPEVKEESDAYIVGRAKLECLSDSLKSTLKSRECLAYTKRTSQLMESVSLCIKYLEPVLLVGETGVGKTSLVQHIANLMKTKLVVVNLSQQSDSSDLLGGYKPVERSELMRPLHQKFEELFKKTFDLESNRTFLNHVSSCFTSARKDSHWTTYLKLVCRLCTKALHLSSTNTYTGSWEQLHEKAKRLSRSLLMENDASIMALAFSEGSLLRAVKEGHWVLLDEINLAEPEVLQSLLLILDAINKSQVYIHGPSDNQEAVKIHPNFRVFACMNPSTDIGKRDLPIGIRGRFSEFFVDDITEISDLRLIVESYVLTCLSQKQIGAIVNFYREVRARSNVYSDISGNSPVYSLRTLCRALSICSNNVCRNIEKSLFESLRITFLQQLNESSIFQVMALIEQTLFGEKLTANLKALSIPKPKDDHQYVQVGGFWIQKSNGEPSVDGKYILTKSVEMNLQRLSRIISLSQRRLPILIQGNTSVGKTSLITYLAKITGNKCYRINNHEHTDLQEYLGQYVLKENGELVFQEGLLVRAMKKGYWIILDELNLAPCELLEALNRVLDENRELFIPETREVIKAHSKFMLFATQNPPEEYAGRKLLSRAFRNRFIELHFDDIPGDELEVILQNKCELAPQYARKIVTVMKELQILRRESGCFNGKNSFMTMRDLFRWGQRYAMFKVGFTSKDFYDWDQHIANEGLVLLEGRVRTLSEADTVKSIIEKVFKRKLDRDTIYSQEKYRNSDFPIQFSHVHFSGEFKRLFYQLSSAIKYNEPVLLCGLTGCGKTTACQMYAGWKKLELITYNCHLNTESSDFIGGVRPSREEESTEGSSKQTFPWVNGPLVEAMMNGSIFLLDEISLADDAVLERINSVLEPTRSITLAEKNGEEIYANESFRLIATMNPGGDYGKKELSPALRNRFTEIYCYNTTDLDQVRKVIESCLLPPLLKPRIASNLLHVMHKFLQRYYNTHDIISLRDVISWTNFINRTTNISQPRPFSVQEAVINGASLVFFDQIGTCGYASSSMTSNPKLKKKLKKALVTTVSEKFGSDPVYIDKLPESMRIFKDIVRFKKFYLSKGPEPIYDNVHKEFVINAPMVKNNLMKIVRAMMLDRPILLEGDPGAGKTSAVSALARLTGHKLVRINLSEQTDIADLFGSDLPSTNNEENDDPSFCWQDGPMLRAIKDSQWILLDEMNLASQSVLEGLNACFDHRGEIYIPELNKRITVNRSATRIFACQNPYSQGAARKGLPQSFLNRFTSIYIDSHTPNDLILIIRNLYPKLPVELVKKMIDFNSQVSDSISHHEFNLRDIIYWCDLLTKYVRSAEYTELNLYKPDRFVQFVYLDRMRTNADRAKIHNLFDKIFGYPVYEPVYRDIRLGEYSFIMTRSILPRKTRPPPHLAELCILKYQMPYIESIAKAIEFNKMPIIIGEAGVGKRSMVKILAGLTGNDLNIICANQEMDTVELLGSFEQRSLQREVVDLIEKAKSCVTSMINSISQKNSARTWSRFFNHIWTTLYATSIRDIRHSKSEMINAYQFQLTQMKDLIHEIQPLSTSCAEKRCGELIEKIDRLMRKLSSNNEFMFCSGSFEWIDSILVKSIKEGTWLMIENANLMNPATLDRLNSLVEPNGSVSLNEKGSGPQGIEILKPHPNFRLILMMDHEHGELSRAMRNRGVEIYVQMKFYFEDFLMLIAQNGFGLEDEKTCMPYCIMQTSYDVHKKITGEEPSEDGSLLAYFGLNYIPTLTHEMRRGIDIDKVLASLLIEFYKQKNFGVDFDDKEISDYVVKQMTEYRKVYEVDLNNQRYKWLRLHHDLVSMTGGDAITVMLDRDNRIFFEDFNLGLLFKPEEIVDHIDIVNTCIQVKIFLEQSTHGDFEYRKGFIRETFIKYPNMMNIVNDHVDLLQSEYIPMIKSLLPRSELAPVSELPVDSRNAPDIHYYLESLDYKSTKKGQDLQNRWLLSLHRIMLRMIVDLVEERTMEVPGNNSLWAMCEQVRSGRILKEDLLRPSIEIASDLYDLLNGILRVVSNRCFDDRAVVKMLAKLFWISYFICKLRRGYSKSEMIAVCNQLPMLWALTYQKVIVPIIKDCEMADISYKNKKFSNRIKHISDFLEMTLSKPSHIEKKYYRKVLNSYASTLKVCESISREVDKFFVTLVGKYTNRSHVSSDNFETLAASGIVWSNSSYLELFYKVEDMCLLMENAACSNPDNLISLSEEAKAVLRNKKTDYNIHEEWLTNEQYRNKCLSVNRRRNALDQFAPVWQLKFILTRFSKLMPDVSNPMGCHNLLRQTLRGVNGIMMSPKYYSTLTKFLHALGNRKNLVDGDEESSPLSSFRQDHDMYTSFLIDHLLENIVLDHQIVGWTKLRVTTSDLPSQAPLIPEYSSILSLVASYCLDISHLKLNSYLNSSSQIDSMLVYLWRDYTSIKLNSQKDTQDIDLAKNLIHLRTRIDIDNELLGSYKCKGPNDCQCVDEYIKRRLPTYDQIIKTTRNGVASEDVDTILKSLKLIYFGYLNYLEYAPIFTLDPSLRCREKLEVYKSELSHVKLELYFRNTMFYWKTGENLQLNEIDPEESVLYPFSSRVLVERRDKLEKAIQRLSREHSNRPKSDDGSIYYELRKDVETDIGRYTSSIQSIMKDFIDYARCRDEKSKAARFSNLITRNRMLIKSLEKSISRFKSDYLLYSDLTTNFLVGMCFVRQGLRCLYSKLEQKMQIQEYGFAATVQRYMEDIDRVFSFKNITQNSLSSAHQKLEFFPRLEKVCPQDKVSQMQSMLLRTILIQLNHHITITPSDIEKCISIVYNIADLFHAAWLQRKIYLETQRKQKEELYQYKSSRTTLGNDVSFERQEFLDICTKFPTYDHVYTDHVSMPITSADQENLKTEEKVINLNRSVDLTMCIDICKAHYKFIKEASHNLLGQIDSNRLDRLPSIDLSHMIKMEAETLYTITRHCIPTFDQSFDSLSIENHILQANYLRKALQKIDSNDYQLGSLRSSIDILDEDIFDIYHDSNAYEALRFQELISKIDSRISSLRNQTSKNYDSHPTLQGIFKLLNRISSFLISDPLMKFVTGSHTLLEKIEEWNSQSISSEDKMINEFTELIELIKSWRGLEIESWRSSLHKVKKKYIDNSLCDLWFEFYEAFNDPIKCATQIVREQTNQDDYVLAPNEEEYIYTGFVVFIKRFLEAATFGDYQIRLDLVFSFAIQTRFASLYEQARATVTKPESDSISALKVDYEKLTVYVYNTYIQYQGLMEHVKDILGKEESILTKELNSEVKIVSWQGRNLWEIRNNFRISHRKLNRVMNKYLELLRQAIPVVNVEAHISDIKPPSEELDSERISMTLISIQLLVDGSNSTGEKSSQCLISLKRAPKVVVKMKQLYKNMSSIVSDKYVTNLSTIEQALRFQADAIGNFYSHKVHEVVIEPKDSKEVKVNKYKTCRQMHHSKKFSLQSIFKSLQTIGVSYQRGLNNADQLDINILSLEPLRGLIQNQSSSVLKAASRLVDDNMIELCNHKYRKVLAKHMILFAQVSIGELNSDQMNRIRGYTLDMVLDIVKHYGNAAFIYRHLIDIQAATTRMMQLQGVPIGHQVVYNFKAVHKVVKQFDDIVGRAHLALSKIEELVQCCSAASELITPENQDSTTTVDLKTETCILKQLICEVDEENSLMSHSQFYHIKTFLTEVRKTIAEVSYALRDMLNYTIRNHVYCDDDIELLQSLYDKFSGAFSQLLAFDKGAKSANLQEGTVLSSLKSLLSEVEHDLKPAIDKAKLSKETQVVDISQFPNLKRLNTRLQKLIKQSMLAIQGIYKEETARDDDALLLGESAKRKLKPFNYIDSTKLRHLMRLDQVAKHVGNCFITLNHEKNISADISPIVTNLTPILFIYTQNIASYLNIILASLQLKLDTASQLIPFFMDLISNGFGLPWRVDDAPIEGKQGKASEDNAGFGEGQGDVDVSKKLEFESQLDDLKTKDPKDNETHEKNESVEAHDDGVEMSEDIDAKAEGANEKTDPENNQRDPDEEIEEDGEVGDNELDKEFDTVDQDEGKLDEKIWSDEDEAEDEDDEEDLREAEMDSTMKSLDDKNKQLQAKDENLTSSKPDEKQSLAQSKVEQQNKETSEPPSEEPEAQPINAEDLEAKESQNDELSPEDEATLALQDGQVGDDKDEKTNEDQEDLSVEMDISDSMLDGDDQENEIEPGEGEILDDQDNSLLDDEIIDEKLESELRPQMLDEILENPIEETIRYMQSNSQNDAREPTQQMKGTKLGNNTIYDIYTEEEDDPIDFDEALDRPEQSELQDESNSEQVNKGSNRANTDSSQQKDIGAFGDSKETQTNEVKDTDKVSDNSQDSAKSSKRTFAESDDILEKDEIKRQKIAEAVQDKTPESKDTESDKPEGKIGSNRVRHIVSDTPNAIEVIDLISSCSDEEHPENIVEQTEHINDGKLDPGKSERAQKSSKEDNQFFDAKDSDQNSQRSEGAKEDNEEFMSPISSVASKDMNEGEETSTDDYVETDDLRDLNTTHNTNYGLLKFISAPGQEKSKKDDNHDKTLNLMKRIDNELCKKSILEHESVDTYQLTSLWLDCTRRTDRLVNELCQQLQIVLQPTKMSKYKGDYKTGKRLNMRKIISYIASHYRKDKIWLRRTKPSKRTYSITIAVDNSSSMSENNCRQMTYQSLALLAKSLSLIEAGSLSVVSFGERVKCIHEFGQPYVDAIGAQWLRELRFNESRTSYKLLLSHSCESFAKQAQATQSQSNISQLLVILSDGRNVTNDEEEVKARLRQLKSMGVLTLFVIIDDLKRNDGNSIVDVKKCIGFGSSVTMLNYMELFPFPFYVLLRKLETMPSILGEALRQWFEIVSRN